MGDVETNSKKESILERTSDHSSAYFSSTAGGCGADAVHSINNAHTRGVDHDGGQLVADLSKRNDVGRILAFQARRVRRNKRIYLQALQRYCSSSSVTFE